MADGKNSIIVYRDWKNIFDELTNEEAGVLIKHFFAYVNDENPELNDKYLKMAFLPIKDALKRDLKHWELVKEKRSESGRLGGLKSGETRSESKQTKQVLPKRSKTKQKEANEAVSVLVNVIGIKDEEVYTPTKFEKFNNWIQTERKNVSKMSVQMTEKNFNTLIATFGDDRLISIIDQMENKKDLTKKYTSVYLTANTWLKR